MKGVNATESLIHSFIIGTKQQYDLAGNEANFKYQALHVMQLDWLYEVTKKEIFKTYHDIFLEAYIIESNSKLTFRASLSNETINVEGDIVWNRFATGDNRLYHRISMLFEGYHTNETYLQVQTYFILRESNLEDVIGPLDPNASILTKNFVLNDSIIFNLIEYNFSVNYVVMNLHFNSYLIDLTEQQGYRNIYVELIIMLSIIFAIFIAVKLVNRYLKTRARGDKD